MKIKKKITCVLVVLLAVQTFCRSFVFASMASMWDTSFEKNLIVDYEDEQEEKQADVKLKAPDEWGLEFDDSDLYEPELYEDSFVEQPDLVFQNEDKLENPVLDLLENEDPFVYPEEIRDETADEQDFFDNDTDELFSDGKLSEEELSKFEEEDLSESTLLALAPALMATGELAASAVMSEAPVLYASSGYTITQSRMVWVNDTMGRWVSTGYRFIHYTDSEGVKRTSPLYCMNASRGSAGVQGPIDASGATKDVQVHNVQFLNNINVQKLLYFGYGGPGDITKSIDPTCSHIDWSSDITKYCFTHYALSYLYSGDLGSLTKDRATESGLFRYIDECKKRDLPSFNDLSFYVRNNKSDAATGTYTSGTSIKTKFTLERKSSAAVANLTGFTDGYQISNTISIHGCKQNYVTIKTHADKSVWQILYWNTKQEKNELGLANAHVAAPGSKIRLYGGSYFRIVAAKNRKNPLVINTSMALRPTEFIVVPGNQNLNEPAYANGALQQDFGAYIYTEDPAPMSIEGEMQPYGTVEITKTDCISGSMLSNVVFDLYAADKIYSGLTLMYEAKKKIDTVTTSKGKASFTYLYPGKYYLLETSVPKKYLLSDTPIPFVITKEDCSAPGKNPVPVTVSVENSPDLKVSVSLKKVDEDRQIPLPGAVFAVDEWNGQKYVRCQDITMDYDEHTETYKCSSELVWSSKNQGKFRIHEIQAPPGYEGTFSKEFDIAENYPEYAAELYLGTVTNKKIESGQLFVAKLDSSTGMALEGAEFSLYRKNQEEEYEFVEILEWDAENRIYKSHDFRLPKGSDWYLLKETKAPDGYLGEYEEEIEITEEEAQYNLYKEVLNDPLRDPEGVLKIYKTDSKTGQGLLDAEFEVRVWNGQTKEYEEYCMMPYDAEQDCYCLQGLPVNEENQGRYYVKETRNPKGYTGEYEEELQFDLAIHEVQVLERNVTNEPPLTEGEITVIKQVRAEDVNTANGYPVFHFVVTGCDIRGERHQYEDYIVIVPDAEGISENESGLLSGAVVFSGIPEGDYTVYEKPVSRYYLADLSSVSPNTTIFRSGNVGYGGQPKDSFYATVSLRDDTGEDGMSSILTFFNEKKRWDRFSHTAIAKNTVMLE